MPPLSSRRRLLRPSPTLSRTPARTARSRSWATSSCSLLSCLSAPRSCPCLTRRSLLTTVTFSLAGPSTSSPRTATLTSLSLRLAPSPLTFLSMATWPWPVLLPSSRRRPTTRRIIPPPAALLPTTAPLPPPATRPPLPPARRLSRRSSRLPLPRLTPPRFCPRPVLLMLLRCSAAAWQLLPC